jgi:hypothetical protein
VRIAVEGELAVTVPAAACRPRSPITSSFDPVVVTSPVALVPATVGVTSAVLPRPVSNGVAVLTPLKATITAVESLPPV